MNLVSRVKNLTIQDPELDESENTTYHQVCVITASGREVNEDEQSEAFDDLGNPMSIPQISREEHETSMWELNKEKRCNYRKRHGTELQDL
jgi:hypothetical protein